MEVASLLDSGELYDKKKAVTKIVQYHDVFSICQTISRLFISILASKS